MKKTISTIESNGDAAVIKSFSKKTGEVSFIIDAEDVNRVKGFNWRPVINRLDGSPYACTFFKQFENGKERLVSIRLHQLITSFEHDIIDHINMDTLDNRSINLRPATRNQNAQNRGATKKSTTGYKGVYQLKNRKKFIAQIKSNKSIYHLGSFETKDLAALAYNEAAIKHHGEFAKLNIINPQPVAVG